ncbi:CocE/NonD family hydrolase, partial [Weissella confusa]
MKINQYAVVETPFEQQVHELTEIGFYDESVTDAMGAGAAAVWQALLVQAFPEYRDATPKLRELAVDNNRDVATFLQSGAPLTTEIFDAVALQLLGFTETVDYQIDQPMQAVHAIGLPLYEKRGKWDVDDVLTAWYALLTTHTAGGLQFIDDLASHGYFAKTNLPLFFNGKAMATFDTSALIKEVVYVETDVDTDEDGVRDLVRVEILRPDTSVDVPVLFTASPYYQGLNNEANDAKLHTVDLPLSHKTPNKVRYEDIAFPGVTLPDAEQHEVVAETDEATESFKATSHVDINNYFLARGFAVAYSSGVGTRHSDGMQDTGSPEQVLSMKAVVEWLAGNRVAFTDRTSGYAVEANWSNGKV